MEYEPEEHEVSEDVCPDGNRIFVNATETYARSEPVNDMEQEYPQEQTDEEAHGDKTQPRWVHKTPQRTGADEYGSGDHAVDNQANHYHESAHEEADSHRMLADALALMDAGRKGIENHDAQPAKERGYE